MPSRPSTESDRKHLLAPPSRPASLYTNNIDPLQTPSQSTTHPDSTSSRLERSQSTPNATTATQPYRGFSSEEAYLSALREWVLSKTYYESDYQLVGFYGGRRSSEYISSNGGPRALSKEERAREKERKEKAKLERILEEGADGERSQSKVKALGNRVFRRRKTVV